MPISEAMKKWLVAECGVKNDDAVVALTFRALVHRVLSVVLIYKQFCRLEFYLA